MEYRHIDMDTYARRAHFDYFRSLEYPYAGVTVNVDVTEALAYCRRHGRSFFLAVLHAAALAADGVPELRQRIRGGGIVEYEECPTSHIEPTESRAYCYCTLRHHMALDEYFEQAERARIGCAKNGINEEPEVESMYFISSLPWLHYTSIVQPAAGGDESNPRITWGRYEQNEKGRYLMPVSITVHHALADGAHIARFYENLSAELEKYGAYS
ncbi:MAG: chloramphenicol acetyltransferase [Clostridia bacterium]|nr:chloramphenicol acetyltransferase [Clostridia bacterium]